MSRGIFAVVALAIAGAACLSPQPAKADGFSFSYSTGYYGHGHGRPYYHRPYYAPRPVYYGYGPRVIYRAPPVVYAAPPTVVYADPPPVIAAPPVIASSVLPGGPLQQPAPYCREYQTTTTVGGQRTASYGTACQQPDGSWRIVQ
ncbi:MAG TPA: hypothetical protein VGO34_05640 [Alphaproteobacteria bacterium]|jgi:hypothetical protein